MSLKELKEKIQREFEDWMEGIEEDTSHVGKISDWDDIEMEIVDYGTTLIIKRRISNVGGFSPEPTKETPVRKWLELRKWKCNGEQVILKDYFHIQDNGYETNRADRVPINKIIREHYAPETPELITEFKTKEEREV